MDVDSPNLKPRPALENAAACLVYISHTINILTTLLATVALLQVFLLGIFDFQISMTFAGGVSSGAVLGPMGDCDGNCTACPLLCLLLHSSQVCHQSHHKSLQFAFLCRYVPARLCLHIVSCLLALWAGFVMVQVMAS